MTLAKAKVIFATHMQAARTRKLTAYETNQLSQARQILRAQRKPIANSRKRGLKSLRKNPRPNPQATLIYSEIHDIRAHKGQQHICDAACVKADHNYIHKFTSKARIYGLANGDILITNRKL